MNVIIIEDDVKISKFMKKGLEEELCTVDTAFTAKDALYLCDMVHYNVIILDWMLPDLDGIHVIKILREKQIMTPILMLTAKGNLDDRVLGLEKGADDYMSKPFAFVELVARIRALHRRNISHVETSLRTGDFSVDTLTREVIRNGKTIELTTKEYKLIVLLLEYKGRIVTNTMILESVWEIQDEIHSNVVNVTMYHLRQKIDKEFTIKLIETIRGVGYRILDV